jgi:hypothetical protein
MRAAQNSASERNSSGWRIFLCGACEPIEREMVSTCSLMPVRPSGWAGGERYLSYFHLPDKAIGPRISENTLQLRVRVDGDRADYFYSLDDGLTFHPIGVPSQIRASWWKGPRPSLFAYTTADSDPGTVDFDWVHYLPTGANPW